MNGMRLLSARHVAYLAIIMGLIGTAISVRALAADTVVAADKPTSMRISSSQYRQAISDILIVNGHPDPRPERFCAALCSAYKSGADLGGWHAGRLDVGALAFGADGFLDGREVDDAVSRIRDATRLIIVFPLWLDQAPAILRSLFGRLAGDGMTADGVSGRDVATIITMEMPAFAHRALTHDACTDGLSQRLSLPGIGRQKPLFIGGVDTISPAQRAEWLRRVREQGKKGL